MKKSQDYIINQVIYHLIKWNRMMSYTMKIRPPFCGLKGFRNMIYSLKGRRSMNDTYEKLILLPLKYLYMEISMSIRGLNFVLLLDCVGK